MSDKPVQVTVVLELGPKFQKLIEMLEPKATKATKATKQEEPAYTLDDLKDLGMNLVNVQNKTAEAKEILTRFTDDGKVGSIPKSKYAECAAALIAAGAETTNAD